MEKKLSSEEAFLYPRVGWKQLQRLLWTTHGSSEGDDDRDDGNDEAGERMEGHVEGEDAEDEFSDEGTGKQEREEEGANEGKEMDDSTEGTENEEGKDKGRELEEEMEKARQAERGKEEEEEEKTEILAFPAVPEKLHRRLFSSAPQKFSHPFQEDNTGKMEHEWENRNIGQSIDPSIPSLGQRLQILRNYVSTVKILLEFGASMNVTGQPFHPSDECFFTHASIHSLLSLFVFCIFPFPLLHLPLVMWSPSFLNWFLRSYFFIHCSMIHPLD